jgi:predicted DNA-binding WGR domain protein
MRLVRQTRLHFREGNSDKIYEVDLCETNGLFLVNFRYGKRGADLKEGTKTNGAVAQAEAEKIFQKLVDEKTRKGYQVLEEGQTEVAPKPKVAKVFDDAARRNYIVERLREAAAGSKKKHKWQLERVIWRAGELKIKEAAPHIINLIGKGNALHDYCCAWALGFCAEPEDETAFNVVTDLMLKSGDATQRICGEAVLKIVSAEKRRQLQDDSISALPVELGTLAQGDVPEDFEKALRSYLEQPVRRSHQVLVDIYLVDNQIVRPALLNILREISLKPKYFKPVRHIFKIAEYRRDAEVFGIIAKHFETKNQQTQFRDPMTGALVIKESDGEKVNVSSKSYYIGKDEIKKEDSRLVYGSKTREYLRRRTWRTLRRLGEINDLDYVKMAVGSLLEFSDADAQEPRKTEHYDYYHTGQYNWRNPKITEIFYDTFAPYLLFNHILYQNSPRYELKNGSRAFRTKNHWKPGRPLPKEREEAFPALWEQQPVGLLHLLSESNCQPVHEFAAKALRDCREFCDSLDVEAIKMLLERPYEVTAQLGFELAKARFDAANPDVELVVAVALCSNAEARKEAQNWISQSRELYAKNGAVMVRLLTAEFTDVREFAANLLKTTVYSDDEANIFVGRLIAEMLAFDEAKRDAARDLGEAVFKSFGNQLRKLNLSVIRDLLAHPLAEVQELGGNILLVHETPAEQLPGNIINSLISSSFESIRGIGIKLFGQLPDENLRRREDLIASFLEHELVDIHNSTRPIVARLAANYPDFTEHLAQRLAILLLQPEKHEGVHARLLNVLRELPDWTRHINLETPRMLVKAESSAAQEAGGLVLAAHADEWFADVSTEEIIDLTNHEVLAVRQASWKTAQAAVNRFQVASNEFANSEVTLLVRALDATWNDSREFWFAFFREKLTAAELTPQILVSICDSVKDAVQKFGRDLLQTYFTEENGAEYMLKLSEHPTANMQLFVTNYFENYAADSPERIRQLAPYFVRVLSLVNRGRIAKSRSLAFLEREAMKNEETAQIAAEILARQSATAAIGDKAATIETMLKIRRKFPEIELPITVKPVEVRFNAR